MEESIVEDTIPKDLLDKGEFYENGFQNESGMLQESLSGMEYIGSNDCNENTDNPDDGNLFECREIDGDKHDDRSTQKGMHTLQSQQQRLQREAQFSVPYHKPKKYTLQEFLNRRTIIKPSESVEQNQSPEAFVKSRNLKMSRDELAIYSKLMEDRAKEASEFFKAENTDTLNESSSASNKKKQHSPTKTNTKINDIIETSERNKYANKSISNVIITEVVELPKLDLKDVTKDFDLKNIVNQSILTEEKTHSLNSNAGTSDIFKASPTLQDDVDITFDFLSKDKMAPKSISKANSLLERLMKTKPFHKPKNKEVIDMLSPKRNSKILIDDAETSVNMKPGETFLKLKDNLKTIIMEKRREEIKKRQDEENAKRMMNDAEFDDEKEFDDSIELDDETMPRSGGNSESEADCVSETELESQIEIEDKDISFDRSDKVLAGSDVESKAVDIKRRIQLPSDDSDESESEHYHSPPPISQVPATQICNPEEETDQLMNLCSGAFETQHTALNEDTIDNKIISSSEDELSDCTKSRTKRFKKKVKKSKLKLGFSDDEADGSDEPELVVEVSLPQKADELPATYIDYDSEENEITVDLTKQECVKQAESFFEKEAELSESEWGSADEDEKNLDQYDIELGDEDEFDREEVRAQLEKIHARKMLDEDIRQVNKLQEILFEDKEDDSARRQRKFRWKNFGTAFNLELNPNQLTDSKPEDGSDDESEHLWRKIRFEREQAIKNHHLSEIPTEANTSVNIPNVGDIKNITIVTMSKSRTEEAGEKEKSPFLISKELIKVESAKARSSFLLRNKKALTKTICSVKNSNTDVNTSPDKIGVKTINPSKFVFTTLSFEEHETLKRKADDTADGTDMKIIKRPKSESRRSEYLIDKLL